MRIVFIVIFIVFHINHVDGQSRMKGELLVQLNDWLSEDEINDLFQIQEWQIVSKDLKIQKAIFNESLYSINDIIYLLSQNEKITYVSENRLSSYRNEPNPPNDSLYFRQWDMDTIQASLAWSITTGGLTAADDTIVVAVIDEGVDWIHEDLQENLWYNYAEIPNDGLDNDDNGYVDDYRGWSFIPNNDNHPNVDHGTASVGFVGAIGNNNIGVSGVSWTVKVMVLSQALSEAELVAAYDYALQMRKKYNETNGQEGVFVVATSLAQGFSFARPEQFPLLCGIYDELGQQGIINVASTTNQGINVDTEGDVPTGCSSDYLITVTNSDRNDELRANAGFGRESIDLSAPGSGTFSTEASSTYGNAAGTSAAAPHVSGAIGLLYALPNQDFIQYVKNNPADGALLIKDAILDGTDFLPTLENKTASEGRLNVFKSLLLLEEYSNGFEDNLEIVQVFPNPASNDIFIKYNSPAEDFQLMLFNEIGQQVALDDFTPTLVSTQTLHVNISKLQAGVYFAILQNSNERLVARFVVF